MAVQEAEQLTENKHCGHRQTERHMQLWKVTDEYREGKQVLNHAVTDEYLKVNMS